MPQGSTGKKNAFRAIFSFTRRPKYETIRTVMRYENEAVSEYYEEQFSQESFDKDTLKLLNAVCEGIEVPTDEEAKAAVSAHHGDNEWMQLGNEAASQEPLRNPTGL